MPTIALDLPAEPSDGVNEALMTVLDVFGQRARLLDRRRLLIVRLDGNRAQRRAYYWLADELCVEQLRSEMAYAERKAG